ncbi:MAG: hypothetical protein ABSA02_39405 [Trebonia sp.]
MAGLVVAVGLTDAGACTEAAAARDAAAVGAGWLTPVPSSAPGVCPVFAGEEAAPVAWPPKGPTEPGRPPMTATAITITAAAPTVVSAMTDLRPPQLAPPRWGRRCRAARGWRSAGVSRRSAGGRIRVSAVTVPRCADDVQGAPGCTIARKEDLTAASSESSRRVGEARSAARVLSTGRSATGVFPVSPDSKASRSRSR